MLAALQALKTEGIHAKLLASHMGNLQASDGSTLPIDGTIEGNPSITVDGVVVPNGNLDALSLDGASRHYILEAYKHLKPIAFGGDVRRFKKQLGLKDGDDEAGISKDATISDKLMQAFLASLREHRVWSRLGKAARMLA